MVHLEGTREEMARQHGELVRDIVKDTSVPYYAHRIDRTIQQMEALRGHPLIQRIARAGVASIVYKPYLKRMDETDANVLSAFADGAGIPRQDVFRALVLPDAGQWLLSKIFKRNKVWSGAFGSLPEFGCTSFVASGARSELEWIHARNLDYDGYGIFDKYPAVVYFNPTDGGQRYVSFTSLGLHTAGITAYNESGIFMGLHQLYTADTTRFSPPVLLTTEKVIRDARTIDEAIGILRSARIGAGWIVVLSSHREKRAVAVEVNASGVGVREMRGDTLWATNVPETSHLKKSEINISWKNLEEARLRSEWVASRFRTKELVSLEDSIDWISEGASAKSNNVQSVVALPVQSIAYVARVAFEGTAPIEGQYVPVPLDLENLGSSEALAQRLSEMPAVMGRSTLSEDQKRSHALFRLGMTRVGEYGDLKKGLEIFEQAESLDPQAFKLPLSRAFVLLKLSRYSEALRALERAAKISSSDYTQSLIALLEGRTLDLLGRRKEALKKYRTVKGSFSKDMRRAKESGIFAPYLDAERKKMVPDYPNGDLLAF